MVSFLPLFLYISVLIIYSLLVLVQRLFVIVVLGSYRVDSDSPPHFELSC